MAVAGDPLEPLTFYFGACAGGVWKTTDGGTYWENVSDGYFKTAAVGAIAVAESDHNVVYAGTGESCIRGNVSHGDGVYKSTDGGSTWVHIGLEDTRHIARVRVHPKDPDLVYVAALGHAFGPNEQRGVFRSRDGGTTWERVLYRSEKAGAIDLAMDPDNPRIMYASIWEALRQPWGMSSGGPDSGLFRSADGGETWEELTDKPGLPTGVKGRIGVAVSPARKGRVWAMVEAEKGGLYRSDDGGATWRLVNEEGALVFRPFYFSHVYADPVDPEVVYVLSFQMWRSADGGRTFTEVTTPHPDNHDLWIDPLNPHRMIEGNDGGACVSFTGGESWSNIYNQPTAQFYHVTTDNQFPYRVYGAQQDNSTISVPSRTNKGAIFPKDSQSVGPSESGYVAVRPDDPNVVYSGGNDPGGGDCVQIYDLRTGQVRIVPVWPELSRGQHLKHHKYRFQWTYPLVISPHDPDTVYAAGNRVFRTRDEGATWEPVSPELTRADETKMEPSGGPITLDVSAVEYYGTVFAFAESPHEPGVFWAGTDDGLVHLSRDDGKTWENVTPPDLPDWSLVTTIEVSPHNPACAYLAATRYKLDDVLPYLYRTDDYGENWSKITDGIPGNDFTRVVREDPVRQNLLYAGTETGVYVSSDAGGLWQSLQANLPAVPVSDMVVKGNELIISTNGRSFWILDDLSLLRELTAVDSLGAMHLFEPAPTYRIVSRVPDYGPGKNYIWMVEEIVTFKDTKLPNGTARRKFLNAGTNPPEGVIISYSLEEKPETETTLAILDSTGDTIRVFSSRQPEKPMAQGIHPPPTLPAERGMNRFVWDMRYPGPHPIESDGKSVRHITGPLAPPGSYRVRLTVGDQAETRRFELLKNPNAAASDEELQGQFALQLGVRDKLSEGHDAITRALHVRRQVDEWVSRAAGSHAEKQVSQAAEQLKRTLLDIVDELAEYDVADPSFPAVSPELVSLPPRLTNKLAGLLRVLGDTEAPGRAFRDVFDELSKKTDTRVDALEQVMDSGLQGFISLIDELKVPAVTSGSRR